MWRILLVVCVAHATHTAHNTSDVFITYSGHADAQPNAYPRGGLGTDNTNTRKQTERVVQRSGERKGDKLKQDKELHESRGRVTEVINSDSEYLENTPATKEPDDDIVFIPSANRESPAPRRSTYGREREERRSEERAERGGRFEERGEKGERIEERWERRNEARVEEEEGYRRVTPAEHPHNDIASERQYSYRPPQTEAPIEGVYFKPGKNNEQEEEKIRHEQDGIIMEKARKEYKENIESQNPIDCINLDCDNVVESVCGVKMQNKKPKHRLFMNECFFRKVNCGLRYEYNRYVPVPLEDCAHVGNHNPPRKQRPAAWIEYHEPTTRRTTSAKLPSFRRAMTANDNGLPCAHTCPSRCPDQYAPVCAYTFPKQGRVFQNHCLLDQQSCADGSVWHQRPLAECAGMARAEVHERAAFIGWMQRMGILDKKGHFVMT